MSPAWPQTVVGDMRVHEHVEAKQTTCDVWLAVSNSHGNRGHANTSRVCVYLRSASSFHEFTVGLFREVENQRSHPRRSYGMAPFLLPCPRIAGNGDGGPTAISGYRLRGERKGGGVRRLWVGLLVAGGGLDCPRRRRRRLYLLSGSGVLSSSARLDCAYRYRRTGTGRESGRRYAGSPWLSMPGPQGVDADRDGPPAPLLCGSCARGPGNCSRPSCFSLMGRLTSHDTDGRISTRKPLHRLKKLKNLCCYAAVAIDERN